jgi:thiol-disulfide isomerase/thioredoxin
MKNWLFTMILVAAALSMNAQTGSAAAPEAPYLRFPNVPPFKILKVDSSSYFTKEDLKKHKYTMVMYFSPTCDHCKHQTQDILADSKEFDEVEIVMATNQPFNEMKEFYTYYRIADHPNIKLGRDEKYTFPPFYKNMSSLPYLALYDKKGNLITTFQGNQKTATLMTAFHSKD